MYFYYTYKFLFQTILSINENCIFPQDIKNIHVCLRSSSGYAYAIYILTDLLFLIYLIVYNRLLLFYYMH